MATEKQLLRAQQQIAILEEMVESKTRALYLEQQELLRAKQNLERIIHTMQNVLLVTDRNWHVISANSAAEILLGRFLDEIIGQHFCEVFPIEHLCGKDCDRLEVLKRFSKETNLRLDSGQFIPVYVSITPIYDQTGAFDGLVCIASDMTGQKELETQLLQSQKLESIGQLAAGLAHEINTPIQYVRDNTLFLLTEFSSLERFFSQIVDIVKNSKEDVSSKIQDMVEQIKQGDIEYLIKEIPIAAKETLAGAERVASIVKSMKLFSHPGTEEKALLNLNTVIEGASTIATNEWKYVADLEFDFDYNIPSIWACPNRLGQVFLNLIVNAAHAIAEQQEKKGTGRGKIKIRTIQLDQEVQIEVSDNGPGIPADVQGKIFDPFYTTKAPGKGTGQGLSFVFTTIVKLHQGSIQVESEVGKGAKFIIRLPIETRS